MTTDTLTRPAPIPNLNDIDPHLSAADETCLLEVAEVLQRHGVASRFGVTLLHRHFEVGDDEVMIEGIDAENRKLSWGPIKATDELAQGAVETCWRLDVPGVVMGCKDWCPSDSGVHRGQSEHTPVT